MPGGRKYFQTAKKTDPVVIQGIKVPLISDADKPKPTKRRCIGPICDDYWNKFREIRKRYKISWNKLFEIMMDAEKYSYVQNWIVEDMAPSDLCKKINRDTVKSLEPLWWSNLGKNLANGLRDAKDVEDIRKQLEKKKTDTCLIIGAGPSVERFGHLKMLAESDFKGIIFATDKILIPALKAGVDVDYSITVDGSEKIFPFYDSKLVDKSHVEAIFTTTVAPKVIERFKNEIYYFNAFQDDPDHDYKSLSRVLQYMTGHTIVMTGGCCGSTSWILSILFGIKNIGLIGFDFGFDAEEIDKNPDALKKTPYWEYYVKSHDVDKILKKLFKRRTNPFFKNECITDFMFQAYADAFDSMTDNIGMKTNTINCTGAGMVFPRKNIKCLHFDDFLKKYS